MLSEWVAFKPSFFPIPRLKKSSLPKLITGSFAAHASPEDQRRFQWELFEVQKRFEAWALVAPFLDHPDPQVQFFGAHTAQLKIVRDW
jgi:importin-13